MNDVEQQPLFVAPVPSPRQAIVHPLLPSDVGNPETYNLELVNGILQDLEMSQLEQIILDADPTSSSANMEMT